VTTIDLHTHVVPPELIAALQHEPEKFDAKGKSGNGVKVVERDGRPYWENNGKLAEIECELYDVETKLVAMDCMRIDVSAISVAPPTYI
jgi:hypothetical protein